MLKQELTRVDGRTLLWRAHQQVYQLQQRKLPQYIFLSFPKSGRTWARFMIDLYLARNYERSVKNAFEVEHDKVVMRYHRILFTHFIVPFHYYEYGGFPERKTLVPRSHAVLLTRNIYSTLASCYYHVRYRNGRVVTPSQFIRETKRGAISVITFYNLWLALRSEFLSAKVFSYEALKADTNGIFRQILEALGIVPVEERLVEEVIEQSSFERMQQLSVTEAYQGTALAPTDPTNKNSYKVREGKQDGFRAIFSEDDIQYIERLIDDLLIDKTLVDISL